MNKILRVICVLAGFCTATVAQAQGWPTRNAIMMAGELADLADGFPIGAVVERRLDAVRWRVQSPAHGE